MNTTHGGLTPIGGAQLIVVACDGGSRLADTGGTDVPTRTFVAIVTGAVHIGVDATSARITAVFGTGVAIVTVQVGRARDTEAIDTFVVDGTGVAVVARSREVRLRAPCGRIAARQDAVISCVAEQWGRASTDTITTGVSDRAGVSIVAGELVVEMLATTLGCARVCRAAISIIAWVDVVGDAEAVDALIAGSAEVAIFAISLDCKVATGAFGRTEIFRADVIIVAIHGNPRLAHSGIAGVVDGAGVAVATAPFDIFVRTTTVCSTDVQSAAVAVIA